MRKGVPVSVTEWMTFVEALYNGYFQSSLDHLYYIGRAFLVKSEAYYDHYDLAFQEFFGGIKQKDLNSTRSSTGSKTHLTNYRN